ncbi:MAG: APC family permease [Leptolyngbyaceae cyanobacterium SM1_3_5]|nr:APC family permease [Leptolyngbyaceae cyanobacterium SM1_3_5]
MSFADVLSQSVSLAAPSIGIALNIPLVFASAGNGAWLAFTLATVGLVLVSLNINQFARRSASAGALYLYVAKGLGSTIGIVCGWALVLAYLLVAAAVAAGFAKYADIVLTEFGIQVPSLLLCALCVGFAWYYAYTDIQLAAMLMIIIEVVAMGFILLLAFSILGRQGFRPDVEQFTLAGVTPGGISLGMVIAIFSFVGFESAATLGDEAKSPTRSIPRSLVWSALLIGLFFILLSYSEVLGFRGSEILLNQADSPISVLADSVGADC